MKFDFDLFVIGGGSGGVRAARLAAGLGKNVALAEGDRMGGTCVIRGCVPKKLMLLASDWRDHFHQARGFGWSFSEGIFDWSSFQKQLIAELNRLEGVYEGVLEKNKVRVFHSFASLDDDHHVVLNNGLRFSAEKILIASGSHPFVPEFEGREHVITSDDIFHLEALPRRMAIIGGGYVASEFAGIFLGLGVEVTQIYRGPMILRGYDREMCEVIADEMRRRGVNLLLNTDVEKIELDGDVRKLRLSSGEVLEAEQVLYATGRVPNIAELGLQNAGVKTEKGAIKVDAFSQTTNPSIYAIGDVTGRVALTPVAIREGVNFVKTVYENAPTSLDYSQIPTAIFTRPEFGTVGLSEEMAKEKGFLIKVFETSFTPMKASFSQQREKMKMKLIVDQKSDLVLGVHILGEGAAEMIQLAAIPLKMGAVKAQFDATLAVHPTAAEELVTMKTPRT